jgi:transposase InsO family protein
VYSYYDLTKQAVHQHQKRTTERELYYGVLLDQSKEVRRQHGRMGAKVIYDLLQPEHIGRVGFERLLMNHGFRVRKIKNYFKTTDSNGFTFYRNLIAGTTLTGINQVWVSDITYFLAADGTMYYLIALMDLYSRRVIGYAASTTMEAEQTSMKALKMALKFRGNSQYSHLVQHSDRGSQYRYKDYTALLKHYTIKISMCDNVYDNAHMERLNSTLKNDYLYLLDTSNFRKLQSSMKRSVELYNDQRPHSSIMKMAPAAYEQYIQKLPTSRRPKMDICPQQSPVYAQNLKEKSSKKENPPADNSNNNKEKKVNTI